MKVGQITIQETAGTRVGRLIDVGETVRAGCPAAAAVLTYCIEQKSLTLILYVTAPRNCLRRMFLRLSRRLRISSRWRVCSRTSSRVFDRRESNAGQCQRHRPPQKTWDDLRIFLVGDDFPEGVMAEFTRLGFVGHGGLTDVGRKLVAPFREPIGHVELLMNNGGNRRHAVAWVNENRESCVAQMIDDSVRDKLADEMSAFWPEACESLRDGDWKLWAVYSKPATKTVETRGAICVLDTSKGYFRVVFDGDSAVIRPTESLQVWCALAYVIARTAARQCLSGAPRRVSRRGRLGTPLGRPSCVGR